jgi:hypothetical protein
MFNLKLCAAHSALAISLLLIFGWPDAFAADLAHGRAVQRPIAGKFVANCENVGRFCHGETCGADQIEASTSSQSLCPGSVIVSVEARRCALGATEQNEHYIPLPDILPDF